MSTTDKSDISPGRMTSTTELYILSGRLMSTTDKSTHLIRENDEHNRILNISPRRMTSTTDKSTHLIRESEKHNITVHLIRENAEHSRQKCTFHQGE